MKRTISFAASLALTVALVWFTGGRPTAATTITQTTLSTAMTATSMTATVASSTGLAVGSFLYIDGELLAITAVSSTTATVRRAVSGSFSVGAVPHASGAVVYVGVGEAFLLDDQVPGAACTAANELYAPHINTRTNRFFECDQGIWFERFPQDTVHPLSFTTQDDFDRGYTCMQDDGTACSVTDDEDSFILGSPLGAIEYREELTKTASSWITTTGKLDIGADDTTDDEGVEILFGTGELEGYLVAGTTGGCIAASITLTDISGTDQLHIGFRDNAAFPDVAAYAGLTVWNAVGVNNVDGSIVSSQEVSEATDTDDSGVNYADGETRALRVCVSAAGVPTAYYTDAYTYSESVPDFPAWKAITMTETGTTMTAATALAPFLSFMAAGTDGPNPIVNWVRLTRLPR